MFVWSMCCRSMWRAVCGLLYLGLALTLAQNRGRTQELAVAFEIAEESPAQTFVGNVAFDAGLSQIFNSTTLKLLEFGFIRQSGQDTDYFHIESDTGILRTSRPIDRDERCPGQADCTINIVVAIQKPISLFRTINVAVSLVDTNDNGPTFHPRQYSIKFSESDPVGTQRSLPIALDSDSPRFGVQDYRMTTHVDEFELEKNINIGSGLTELKLVLVQPLDREMVDTYMLTIISTDGGNPAKSGSLLIDVTVEDDNDHSPEFDQTSYSIEVSEGTSTNISFFTVRAHDPDSGDNGQVEYHFSPITSSLYGEQFRLYKRSGQMTLRKKLDYESKNSYILEVVANDKAPNARSTLAQIELTVLDINDNFPEITVDTLTEKSEAEIMENMPSGKSEFVAFVSVFDADIGENGNVMCGLSHPSFHLTSISQNQYKIVTEQSFDREAIGSYILKVECYDMGDPSLSSSKDLVVNILDANDHAPVFYPNQYSESVRENNLRDSFIVRVHANDSDVGQNRQLRYDILEQGVDKYVYIQESSGVVRSADVLDYEKIQRLEFTVVAHDQGTPQRSATAFVTINILDTNDEPPRFDSSHYTFSVIENKDVNTVVGQVSAFDLDSPPYNIFEYSLDSRHHEDKGCFTIDILNGQIITLQEFDRETRDVYYLTVFANDIDNPSLIGSASVTIYITDANDNYPVIAFPDTHNRTFEISNQAPVGFNITRVSALDDDIGDNARLTFGILSGDDRGLFAIDEMTGLLSVVQDLTAVVYEEVWVRVVVSDSGAAVKVDTIDVLIIVDNALLYIPPGPGGESMVRRSNLLVIIVVAAVSGFIIVILIIAIALLKTLDRRRFRGKEYNCRTEEQKILNDLNLKAVEANGNLHARERMEHTVIDCNTPPQNPARNTGSLTRKKERSPPLELSDLGSSPHVARNNLAHDNAPSPHGSHSDVSTGGANNAAAAAKHAQDKHLEAHLMALLKQDQDADSASSADMSNADSGRGASEEGEGGPRYVSPRPLDHLPTTLPAPPGPPHGYAQPRYTQPPCRVAIRLPDARAGQSQLYAHGHTSNSPGRPTNTSTFMRASSDVDVHRAPAAYQQDPRGSLQSLPTYARSQPKHVTFTGNGTSDDPRGYHTTGRRAPPHKDKRNVDSSGYGSLRNQGAASSSASPKEEVWQHRRRHHDHPLRDITEEDDSQSHHSSSSRGDPTDPPDPAKLCQQIDDIFFKQKSVVV